MKYRSEIDGLRAVAVLPVLFFHADFDLFSGGFIGVDIFFVISGYLITSILIADIDEQRFSLLRFYERRVRRILPALFLVMAACIPFAFAWMWDQPFKDFAQSIAAVTTFAANVLFLSETGYFMAESATKPLLHTWSLAIEEQYYLIFPILIFLIWKTNKALSTTLLVLLFFASLYFAATPDKAAISKHFFYSHARAWELLSGSICAVILRQRGPFNGTPLALLGIVGIGYGIAAFDQTTNFPSLYTLVPTLGTALIILFCRTDSILGRILSNRLLVGVGLISYSLYLWHQPLFAFARLRLSLPPSDLVMLILIAASFGLAILSWKFCEQPVRHGSIFASRRQLFGFFGICGAGFIAFGMAGHVGWITGSLALPPNVDFKSLGERTYKLGYPCVVAVSKRYPGLATCEFGDTAAAETVVLYGDSHAKALHPRLDDLLKAGNLKGIFVRNRHCQVVPGIFDGRGKDPQFCAQTLAHLSDLIEREARAVIVSSRWTTKLYPVPGKIDDFLYTNEMGTTERGGFQERDFRAINDSGDLTIDAGAKRKAMFDFLSHLTGTGKVVYLIDPVPETAVNVFNRNAHHYNFEGRVLDEITISARNYLNRNQLVLSWFDAFDAQNLKRVRTFDRFCTLGDAGRCYVQKDTKPLYYDDDHLSYEGAKLVIDGIVQDLMSQQAKPDQVMNKLQ